MFTFRKLTQSAGQLKPYDISLFFKLFAGTKSFMNRIIFSRLEFAACQSPL